jgi:hypothetical protein
MHSPLGLNYVCYLLMNRFAPGAQCSLIACSASASLTATPRPGPLQRAWQHLFLIEVALHVCFCKGAVAPSFFSYRALSSNFFILPVLLLKHWFLAHTADL